MSKVANALAGMPRTGKYDEAHPRADRRLNEEDWHKVFLLRLRGNTFAATARIAGIGERTVRRLWHEGHPLHAWGQTPMKVLFEQEQQKARALRAEIPGDDGKDMSPLEADEKAVIEGQLGAATFQERKAAKTDALVARTAEATLVRLVRGNAQAMAGASVALMKPAQAIAKRIGENLMLRANAAEINALEGIALLRQTAGLLKDIVESGYKAMEMERMLLGDPTGGGKTAQDAENMSIDDAMTELGNAALVFRGLEAKNLRLIQGGRAIVEAAKPDVTPDDASVGNAFDPNASHTVTTSDESGPEVIAPGSETETEASEEPST